MKNSRLLKLLGNTLLNVVNRGSIHFLYTYANKSMCEDIEKPKFSAHRIRRLSTYRQLSEYFQFKLIIFPQRILTVTS